MYGKIYKITNLCNNKIYIGRTVKTLEERFAAHIHAAQFMKPQKRLKIQNAIRKYGKENFIIELVAECETEEQYSTFESFYIELLNARDPLVGYNIHEGGSGGKTYKDSPPKLTEGQLKGLDYGRPLPMSDYAKSLLSQRRKNSITSDETKLKLRNANLGHKHIHKGTENKCVSIEEYEQYLADGWEKDYYKKSKSKKFND